MKQRVEPLTVISGKKVLRGILSTLDRFLHRLLTTELICNILIFTKIPDFSNEIVLFIFLISLHRSLRILFLSTEISFYIFIEDQILS